MKDGPNIAEVAALIGDPARANMLTALMSGRALTATELAYEAGIGASTASAHLAKLEAGGLIRPRKQGRHKYISLASDEVAAVLEGLMGLAAGAGRLRTRPGPKDPALRKARVCYNHLAGDMGARLYDGLCDQGVLIADGEDVVLTPVGEDFAIAFGIDLPSLKSARAPLCRPCLDWSERRSHLGGALGRAILSRIEASGMARRAKTGRAVLFTTDGERRFEAMIAGRAA